MLKIRVHEIEDAGVLEQTALISPQDAAKEWADLPPLAEPARVTLRAEAQGQEVLVNGEIAAKIALECSRCLEGFAWPLETHFDLQAATRDVFVDVGEEIRQTLLLSLPPKPLCRERCRGLCPRCGKNLNTERCGHSSAANESPFARLKGIKINRDQSMKDGV